MFGITKEEAQWICTQEHSSWGRGLYKCEVDYYMMIPFKKHNAVLKEFCLQEFVVH